MLIYVNMSNTNESNQTKQVKFSDKIQRNGIEVKLLNETTDEKAHLLGVSNDGAKTTRLSNLKKTNFKVIITNVTI